MKLHILSDLHNEFNCFSPPTTDADVVILAGDIDVGTQGLTWAAKYFPHTPVIYVPGNHEFYHHDLLLINKLREQAPHPIHVLNNEAIVIDGVRFLGCVLWTDFALYGEAKKVQAMAEIQQSMNDFSLITSHQKEFTPLQAADIHQASREWLVNQLSDSTENKTVVVTHHAPSQGSVSEKYANDLITTAFASNLDDLFINHQIDLWVHGHMHESFDYQINNTRVICNPRGYSPMRQNPHFKPNMIIEI